MQKCGYGSKYADILARDVLGTRRTGHGLSCCECSSSRVGCWKRLAQIEMLSAS